MIARYSRPLMASIWSDEGKLATWLAVEQAATAAGAGSQEQEYQQVRKIALRDPKVRAAYDEADQRLEAKMVQIDPALKYYEGFRDVPGSWWADLLLMKMNALVDAQIIDELCEVLRIPSIESRGLVAAAEDRAKSLLQLL